MERERSGKEEAAGGGASLGGDFGFYGQGQSKLLFGFIPYESDSIAELKWHQ